MRWCRGLQGGRLSSISSLRGDGDLVDYSKGTESQDCWVLSLALEGEWGLVGWSCGGQGLEARTPGFYP